MNQSNISEVSTSLTLHIDLDGVCADFEGGFLEYFGFAHDTLDDDQMWDTIRKRNNFFRDLPLMENTIQMIDALRPFSPRILTACPRSFYDVAVQEKRDWVRRHLGEDLIVRTVRGGKNKHQHMQPGANILIDDFKKNIKEWEKRGGIGVLYKNAQQATSDTLRVIKDFYHIKGLNHDHIDVELTF